MQTYRLLHLSDLHVAEEPDRLHFLCMSAPRVLGNNIFVKSGSQQASPSLVGQASHSRAVSRHLARWFFDQTHVGNVLSNDVHLTLISGDIATTGRIEDLQAARAYLTGPGIVDEPFITSSGRPTLSLSADRVALLPGNHDRYHDNWATPGNGLFENVFPEYWRHNPVDTWLLGTGNDSLAIVAADLCLYTVSDAKASWGRWGRGRAHRATRYHMQADTKRARERGAKAVIWVIHFPPCISSAPSKDGVNRKDRRTLNLLEDEDLIKMAIRCDVRHILAGHLHKPTRYAHRGVEVLCAGAPMMANPRDRRMAHLVEIDVDNGLVVNIRRKHYEYDIDEGDYHEGGGD